MAKKAKKKKEFSFVHGLEINSTGPTKVRLFKDKKRRRKIALEVAEGVEVVVKKKGA